MVLDLKKFTVVMRKKRETLHIQPKHVKYISAIIVQPVSL